VLGGIANSVFNNLVDVFKKSPFRAEFERINSLNSVDHRFLNNVPGLHLSSQSAPKSKSHGCQNPLLVAPTEGFDRRIRAGFCLGNEHLRREFVTHLYRSNWIDKKSFVLAFARDADAAVSGGDMLAPFLSQKDRNDQGVCYETNRGFNSDAFNVWIGEWRKPGGEGRED
jgi:hypothetical protein